MSQSGANSGSGGGGGSGITTINGDSGSVTGSVVSLLANSTAGASVKFTGSGTTMTLNVSDTNDNTFVGLNSGSVTAINGSANTAIGQQTLQSLNGSLSTGNDNTACGYGALNACVVGTGNTACGATALVVCTGSTNTAVGVDALVAATSSNSCTSVGANCLASLQTGSEVIGIGHNAGNVYTSSESNNIVIGNSGVAAESNVIRIGTQGSGVRQQNKCFVAGVVGVTVSNPTIVTQDSSTGQFGASATLPSVVQANITQTGNLGNQLNTTRCCFSVYNNAVQSSVTGDGTVATVNFGTELFDQGNNFASNTFTAPVTGKYQLNAVILTQNNLATHTPQMRLNVSGTSALMYNVGNFGASFAGNFEMTGSWTIQMTAGDTAVIQVLTGGGTKTVNIFGGAGDPRCIFSGFLVC